MYWKLTKTSNIELHLLCNSNERILTMIILLTLRLIDYATGHVVFKEAFTFCYLFTLLYLLHLGFIIIHHLLS